MAKEKLARRLHDVASLQSGMPGQRIAKKNAWISPETAKKARIILAYQPSGEIEDSSLPGWPVHFDLVA